MLQCPTCPHTNLEIDTNVLITNFPPCTAPRVRYLLERNCLWTCKLRASPMASRFTYKSYKHILSPPPPSACLEKSQIAWKRKTMAAESSSSKTEEIRDFNRSALIGWTSIEEVQKTVAPYVSKVIRKSRSGYGYTSASEVLEDYKTFKALHKTLVEGKDRLFIETYVDEYICHYAMYVKAEMLCVFPYLLVCELQDQQREWIHDQLRRIEYKYDELRSESLGCLVFGWEVPIDQLGRDAQREIREQTVEKCMRFQKYQNDWYTHADKIDKKMREFEELESEISGMKNDLVLLCRRRSTYYKTWWDVEDGFHKLEEVFFQLLRDGEMDLAKKWSDVKLGRGI